MEKKKFEKPSMQVIELKSKVSILQGSGCDWYECTTDGPVCTLAAEDE